MKRPYYGWVLVAVMSAAGAVSMAMGTLNFGLFIKPMGEELGIGRAQFGWAQSGRQLAGAVTSVPLGFWVDRFGVRWLLAGAAAATGLFLGALAYVQAGWQMVALFTAMGLTGFAAPGSLLTSVPVLKWFERDRGRAIAMASVGIPLGALVFLPLTQIWIDRYGWRTSWLLLASVGVLIIVPLSAIFVRRQPEDLGLRPDPPSESSSPSDAWPQESWTLAEALRTRAFWRLTTVFSLVSLSIGTIGLHRIPAFVDRGLDATLVAFAAAIDAVLAGAATFVMGMLAQRVASRLLGAAGLALLALASVLTIFGYTTATMFASMAVFGVGIGGMMFLQNIIWAEYFGRAHLGSIRGAVMPINFVVGAIGAPLAGYVKDATGNYDPVWWVGAGLMGAGALVVAFTHAPAHRAIGS